MHIFRDVLLAWALILGVTANSTNNNPLNATESVPPPLVIPPSYYWDGVDGQWSTFALRVGEPAQDVRVLVSTDSPDTMVVLPEGCTKEAMDPVIANCANSRGGTFSMNSSETWDDQGFFGINENGVGFEADLGYSQNAEYGLETVGLGYASDGPTLKNQTVAGFATTSPFYLGTFGLGTDSVNFTTIGNSSSLTFFSALRSYKMIPSLSWSYTAGANYRLKAGQYAQLIFGGYDSSRFVPNTASFTLTPDIDRNIVVGIQSITYSGTTQANLLAEPVYAFIESTDPNFWLPEAACQEFEKVFGLSIDNSTGLYLINATHYSNLEAANPQITFSLANSLSGGATVYIVLPFNAFTLQASYPFTQNDTYYFPLRKAANDTQNTLGRAFLQEAYLTVDYERGNFSVSQCLWNDGATSQITSIVSPTYLTNNASSTATPPSSKVASGLKKHLSPGAIAGIVISILVFLALAAALTYILLRRRRQRPRSSSKHQKVSSKDITLNNIDKDKSRPPTSTSALPAPVYKVYGPDDTFYGEGIPRIEMPTQQEIYQLPDNDNREGDYMTAAREIRAAATPELEGSGAQYELQGSEREPSELDDKISRSQSVLSPKWSPGLFDQGVSPDFPPPRTPRTPDTTRGSPRLPSPMSPLSPMSDFSDHNR